MALAIGWWMERAERIATHRKFIRLQTDVAQKLDQKLASDEWIGEAQLSKVPIDLLQQIRDELTDVPMTRKRWDEINRVLEQVF